MVVVLLLAFVVSQSCQKSQIRLTKDQAIARAEQQVELRAHPQAGPPAAPGDRLQAVLDRVAVDPAHGTGTAFSELAVIRIDANTGKVADVKVQR